ncbi:MAG TPA: hypothetical protein O0X51_01035, partial [Methanocorpusculum sp.]|nr:hypothetical protein [Methanocorpusculum sp.]
GRNSSTAGNEALVPVRDVKITCKPDTTVEYSFPKDEKTWCLISIGNTSTLNFSKLNKKNNDDHKRYHKKIATQESEIQTFS